MWCLHVRQTIKTVSTGKPLLCVIEIPITSESMKIIFCHHQKIKTEPVSSPKAIVVVYSVFVSHHSIGCVAQLLFYFKIMLLNYCKSVIVRHTIYESPFTMKFLLHIRFLLLLILSIINHIWKLSVHCKILKYSNRAVKHIKHFFYSTYNIGHISDDT